MMGVLTRKKITVRRKGKTFQRSVMVRAESIGKRAGGKKLHSLNPWETRHTEHVSGEFNINGQTRHSDSVAKSRGSSGPGSDHSWLALMVGATKQQRTAGLEVHTSHPFSEGGGRSFGSHHAAIRQIAGEQAARYATPQGSNLAANPGRTGHSAVGYHRRALKAAFGTRSVFHVPQDPNKWVR